MIYRDQLKTPSIHLINDDYKNRINLISELGNVIIVTDPPFNIGYHYKEYNDNMIEDDYFAMLVDIINKFPTVIIHYPEALHRLSVTSCVRTDMEDSDEDAAS